MKLYSYYLSRVTEEFSSLSQDQNPKGLYEPIQYTIEDAGKRMRPLLCLLSASLFSNDSDEICAKVMSSAVALEVFHNFTLLHDDIMDSAPTRRGKPTVHVKWNSNQAILSGDAMVILAYKYLMDSAPLKELLEVFNKAALEVCEGQQFDMEFEELDFVEEARYIEMIRLKTAVLMAAATKMGAIAMGANEAESQLLYEYGENLGLAFQIQDDLLDTYGDPAKFGKKIGGDIAEGKQTFLRIKALEKANDCQREILTNSRDYNEVRAIYDALKVDEDAKSEIERYFTLAAESLSSFSTERKAGLEEYSNLLLRRDF